MCVCVLCVAPVRFSVQEAATKLSPPTWGTKIFVHLPDPTDNKIINLREKTGFEIELVLNPP